MYIYIDRQSRGSFIHFIRLVYSRGGRDKVELRSGCIELSGYVAAVASVVLVRSLFLGWKDYFREARYDLCNGGR